MRQAFLNGVIPSEQRATVLSFDSLMGSAGGVVAQPLLGRVADVSGYAASYLVAAGIQVVALPFVVLARREHASSDPIDRAPPISASETVAETPAGRVAPIRIETTSLSCWRPFSSSELMRERADIDACRHRRIGGDQDLARFGQGASRAVTFTLSPARSGSPRHLPPRHPSTVVPVWTPAPSGSQAPLALPKPTFVISVRAASTARVACCSPVEQRHERGHHLIAHELVQEAVIGEDRVSGHVVEAIQQGAVLAGGHGLGQAGGAADIGKQHRHLDLGAAVVARHE